VGRLREETGKDVMISAPSFDHALKDPTPDAVIVHPYHRIVVIEGLYVLLAIEPWQKAGMMLDERCLIEVDPSEARKRLVTRHVLTGVTKDPTEANWRVDENDMLSESGLRRWFLNVYSDSFILQPHQTLTLCLPIH
jgi:pantothenate kinase